MQTLTRTKMADRAEKLDAIADSFQAQIDEKLAPMSQAWTPKRGRENAQKRHDGHNMERAQKAARALAVACRSDTVPEALRAFKPTKAALIDAVRTRGDSQGYYDYRDTGEPFNMTEEAIALRNLTERQKTDAELEREKVLLQERVIQTAIDKLRFANIDGFFPSPPAVVDDLLSHADIFPEMTVLEPSAGIGSIADEIRARYPGIWIELCEQMIPLVEVLKLKGYRVMQANFLAEASYMDQSYDRVVMNPPFERGEWQDHVGKAYDLLSPGGRLAAVVPCGSMRSGFEDWLRRQDHEEWPLPAGCFDTKDAFNRTGVSCKILVIRKPTGGP